MREVNGNLKSFDELDQERQELLVKEKSPLLLAYLMEANLSLFIEEVYGDFFEKLENVEAVILREYHGLLGYTYSLWFKGYANNEELGRILEYITNGNNMLRAVSEEELRILKEIQDLANTRVDASALLHVDKPHSVSTSTKVEEEYSKCFADFMNDFCITMNKRLNHKVIEFKSSLENNETLEGCIRELGECFIIEDDLVYTEGGAVNVPTILV